MSELWWLFIGVFQLSDPFTKQVVYGNKTEWEFENINNLSIKASRSLLPSGFRETARSDCVFICKTEYASNTRMPSVSSKDWSPAWLTTDPRLNGVGCRCSFFPSNPMWQSCSCSGENLLQAHKLANITLLLTEWMLWWVNEWVNERAINLHDRFDNDDRACLVSGDGSATRMWMASTEAARERRHRRRRGS